MNDATDEVRVYRGLKGVHFDRSPTTYIDGRAGELRYWGYSIHDLAEHSTFEETAYLLLHGELPDRGGLESFEARLKAGRRLPEPVFDIIDRCQGGHPMDVLRTGRLGARRVRAGQPGHQPGSARAGHQTHLPGAVDRCRAPPHSFGEASGEPRRTNSAMQRTSSTCSRASCQATTPPG